MSNLVNGTGCKFAFSYRTQQLVGYKEAIRKGATLTMNINQLISLDCYDTSVLN